MEISETPLDHPISPTKTPIIGTTNPDNAKANIMAANNGPLPEETAKRIRDAFKHAAAEGWPGLQ